MAQDIIKTKSPPKSANPTVGGANTQNFPVFGIVKDNIDPTRAGRIRVLLSGNNPNDSNNSANWVTVSFLSDFFGTIGGSAGSGNEDNGTYKSNPTSYGQWHAPPDIGTTVICIFVNGDPNYGFYIGCVPEPDALHMVPAIGSSDYVINNEGEASSYGGATRLPATNFNSNNPTNSNSPNFNDSPRPVHSYSATIMNQQGIIRDPIRGPISSSASREPASRVGWGVSTPGRPIYEGGFDDSTVTQNLDGSKNEQLKVVARRGGHSIVMDDGDIIGRDQLVRIRTALGHQILMSDDGQTLMILHSNGQSYIELGKEGTIDMYSTNSVNIRTQGDLNLHADRNVNIHAMENLNIQAKNIQTNSEEKTMMRAGSDFNMSATGKLTGLAGGAIAWGAGGDASLVGGGQAFVNGSKVNLNSGAPGTSPDPVSTIPLIAQTDTLYDEGRGFMAAPGKLLTIVSRAPAHAPWANAGQGVDVKTNLDAASQLPAAPSPAVAATTAAAANTGATPPAVATVASAPAGVPAISAAVNNNTTAAALGSIATSAAGGVLAAAVSQGAAVVPTATGMVAAVGAFAQTASQLAAGGILKPGSATLVTGLVQAGANIAQAMPASLFTGAAGALNLTSLVQNMPAQATSVVNTMQQAQTALGRVGAITGSEASTQITGMVTAAATVGLGPTVAAIQQAGSAASSAVSSVAGATNLVSGASAALGRATGSIGGAVAGISGAASAAGSLAGTANSLAGSLAGAVSGAAGQLSGAADNALGSARTALAAIGSGAAAAGLAESIGGLGGIQSALTAMGNVPSLAGLMDQAKGVAASAFDAIKNSFKPFRAGVPQNLTQIARDNAAAAAEVANQTTQAGSNLLNAAGSIAGGAVGALGSATGALSSVGGALSGTVGALGSATGALSSVGGAITRTTGALSSIAGSVGGITNAASINNSVASITGGLTSVTNAITSVAGVGTSISATINNVTAVASSVSGAVTGSALNTTIGGVQNAVNTVSALAGAGATIAAGGTAALTNAAASIQRGASAATSSALASGLSNLPGGINTVSTVVNQAAGAINAIPGLGPLSGAISAASSAAMNGLSSVTAATGALSSLAGNLDNVSGALGGAAGALSGALGDAASRLGGLTALASVGLPVGAIAQLQSSIAALAGGTPGAIALPSVGFNTTDRTAITNQINATLGDPGIPTPNLVGSIPETARASIDELEQQAQAENRAAHAAFMEISATVIAALNEFKRLDSTLPPGDPKIAEAYQKWRDLAYGDEYNAAIARLNTAGDRALSIRREAGAQRIGRINNARTAEELIALNRELNGRG